MARQEAMTRQERIAVGILRAEFSFPYFTNEELLKIVREVKEALDGKED